MKKDTNLRASRRNFLKKSGLAATGYFIVPRHVLGRGFIAPSDRLVIAGIGVGGKGKSDLDEMVKSPRVVIAALCDVDDRRAASAVQAFPKAKYYKDFRNLLDKEGGGIDAVTIATPDHTHAVAAIAAMQHGKHVYLQKPLTHDIFEARMLTAAARKYKVVTQMGNQGGSGDGVRRMKEFYDAGLIGMVTKVTAWTNRPIWPQGIAAPTGKFDIPKQLDWDLWLGPAQQIDYHPDYLPFNWRGWYSFGTGALGDMACHILDPAFRILPISAPSEIESSTTSAWTGLGKQADLPDSFPNASILHYKFPGIDGKPDIELTWIDGGLLPQRPAELSPDEPMGDWSGGIIFEGTKGKMMADSYGVNPRLIPAFSMKQDEVPVTLARVPEGHYIQWVNACIAGYGKKELSSSFDYAGPFTEAILLGVLAIRARQLKGVGEAGKRKLLWDATSMQVTNLPEASALSRRQYRNGWEVSGW